MDKREASLSDPDLPVKANTITYLFSVTVTADDLLISRTSGVRDCPYVILLSFGL